MELLLNITPLPTHTKEHNIMAALEGAGALGFSQPIKSDAESIAKQMTRLANQQARQAYTRANTIQKAEEKLERDRERLEDKAYRTQNYVVPAYNKYIGGTVKGLFDEKLEQMLEYIEETTSPPQVLTSELNQIKNGTDAYVSMVKQEEAQLKTNKDLDVNGIIDSYFNTYIVPGEISFWEQGSAIGPGQWFNTMASDEQIRSVIKSEPGYWKNFFASKSKIESQRQVQSQLQGGQRQTETTELDVALDFVKQSGSTIVPKHALELMDGSQGVSLLQIATGNYQDRVAMAMIKEQRDNWSARHMNELIEFDYQDADGQTVTYSKTVGAILSDPDDFGNQFLLAKGLEEAIREYGINRKSTAMTVTELAQPVIISPQQSRDKSDTYAREDDIIRTINTLAMGKGKFGQEFVKDGKVLYPVEDIIFKTAKRGSNLVDVYWNPQDSNFLVVDKKKDVLSFDATEENYLTGAELAVELKYQGAEQGSMQMRLNDSTSVDSDGVYHPEALTNASERVEMNANPDDIYGEISDEVVDIINGRSTLSSDQVKEINTQLKRGGLRTGQGVVTRVAISQGEIIVSFEGKGREKMSMEAFIQLVSRTEVSAVNRYGERKTIDTNVLDVLRGRQTNIA